MKHLKYISDLNKSKNNKNEDIYNLSNQSNDKIVRILIHSAPYKKLDIMLNCYFSIKKDGVKKNLLKGEIYQYQLTPLQINSQFETSFKNLMNLMVNSNPSLNGDYLAKQLLKDSQLLQVKSIGSFFKKIIKKTKKLAKPLYNQVIKKLGNITLQDAVTTLLNIPNQYDKNFS
jgi:hypothetical protein